MIYTATAIIQLTNGERAGESMLSLRKFLDERKEEFSIFSFKQGIVKKLADGRVVEKKLSEFKERIVRIPKIVFVNQAHLDRAMSLAFGHPDNYIPIKFLNPHERAKNYEEYERYVNRYEKWIKNNFYVNSHSLRYAWQNKILEYIENVEIVATIQGRKNLNVLLEYIRSREAQKQYREIFGMLE
ncbi:MAG: hypothetical protein DSY42_03065 [Aquifex sp.]|nr:MAG: hypothetical protein DSY42_03065 [Aquifex sp.]